MQEEENENIDSTNDTEETENQVEVAEEETQETETEVDVDKILATNTKLYERAKKAEAEIKALKAKEPVKAKPASSLDVEETVLLAQGLDEDLLETLKKVAKVNNTGLIKAQTDPIFVAVKEKFIKEKKQQEASLSASRSSGSAKVQKDFTTPGLSREEHMAMFAKAQK